MLFNAPTFIFFFLPLAVVAGLVMAHAFRSVQPFLWTLIGFSLVFYGWQRIDWLVIFVISLLTNYIIGDTLMRAELKPEQRKLLAILGVGLNLAALGYFKYLDFLVANVNAALGIDIPILGIVLPIGISFYTFQQLAFVVDAYRRQVKHLSFPGYLFFIAFFPQLIAGPIVHHAEILPQLASFRRSRIADNLALGLTIFLIGLAKKTLLADTFARTVGPAFALADGGGDVAMLAAWAGVIAYSLQIYFDFSGYSDMAIGIGRMFGLRIPVNFNSPYKATSIIDFWRRWHITLSRFLRDYIYIPLGGNRLGPTRRYTNLLITMLLGGIWHGAGWGFLLWGALHGLYLAINHLWNAFTPRRTEAGRSWAWRIAGVGITLFAVVLAWVPFRATTLAGALEIWQAMFVGCGSCKVIAVTADTWLTLAAGGVIVLLAPNTQQWMERVFGYRIEMDGASSEDGIRPHVLPAGFGMPSLQYACVVLAAVGACAGLAVNNTVSEFIYFQF